MSQGLIDGARTDAGHAVAPEMTRRRFLQLGMGLSAAAGGGMLLGFTLAARAQAPRQPGDASAASVVSGDGVVRAPAGEFAPNAFIRIDRTGQVSLVMMKVEMGQGVYTSFPMLIAEELEVPLSAVKLEHAPPNAQLYSDPLLGGQLTGGSTSIRFGWEPMRRAGAAARTLLVHAAASQWQVDPASCHAENGQVVHAGTGRRVDYGKLVDAAVALPVPPDFEKSVTLKRPDQFKVIGKSFKRLDSPEKVNGVALFGIDVNVPGMQYAAVVHSPVVGGKVASVDSSVASAIPGVTQIVRLDDAVAVIGKHTWAAKQGAASLVIEWDEGHNAQLSMPALVADLAQAATRPGAVARKQGDVDQGFKQAATKLDVVYQQPFLAHATMEPMNCTVHVTPDACDIWVGTQVPTRAIDAAVKETGLSADKIRLHNYLLGGGFGRRLETDGIAQAVRIGRQVNSPVKLTWTREEDIQHDMFRPYYYDHIAAGLDASGRPIAWTHRIVGSSILARFAPAAIQNGVDPDAVEVASDLPYDLPNQLVDYVRQEPRGIATAFWRGVGPTRSTFVVESFVDELAYAAKTDPVAYRRSLLGNAPRARAVLDVATRAAGWGPALPKGQGRGVSVMNAFGSFFGVVVDVTVTDGNVRVDRIACAVDCGHVVNPDTIEAQIQGGLLFGVTAALYSEITFKDGRVEQSNFTDYRMLRINETPVIDVHIVKSTEAPGGMGEPGTAALAPALTNAIYAATGVRIRTLPVGTQLQSSRQSA